MIADLHWSGKIDCSQARLRDPLWWRYLSQAIDHHIRTIEQRVESHIQAQYIGLAGAAGIFTQEGREKVLDQLGEVTDRLVEATRPWRTKKQSPQSQTEDRRAEEARQIFQRVVGEDPMDPEYRERVRQQREQQRERVRAGEQRHAQAQAVTQDLRRRIREGRQ